MVQVEFITKPDNMELITTIIEGDSNNILNIYKYTTELCEYYYQIPNDCKYIGYFNNNIFYVVNLVDEEFNEDFKNNLNDIIHTEHIDLLLIEDINIPSNNNLTTRKEITKIKTILLEKANIYYINFLSCMKMIDLTEAKRYINTYLNNDLNIHNENCNYKLSIDYVFKMKTNTEINSFFNNSTQLLLCIFIDNKCISSIDINYKSSNKGIYIDCKTKNEYKNQKLNTLLTAVIIIIAKTLYNDAEYIFTIPINKAIIHIMMKFNAICIDNNKKVIVYNNNTTDITNIKTRLELNNENIKNAKNVFDTIINQLKCIDDKGGGKYKINYRKILKCKSRKNIKCKSRKNIKCKSRKNRRKNNQIM
jgi:hypothetical protein